MPPPSPPLSHNATRYKLIPERNSAKCWVEEVSKNPIEKNAREQPVINGIRSNRIRFGDLYFFIPNSIQKISRKSAITGIPSQTASPNIVGLESTYSQYNLPPIGTTTKIT